MSFLFIGNEKIVLGDNQTGGDTITPTQTISGTWSGTLTATSDITITSGVVITIASGTLIQVATTDSANAGDDPARIEFIVQSGGELRVNGPVTFTSKAASPAPGDWYGVRFEPGSKGQIDGAVIEYGVHGLILSTTNAITVANSTLRYNRHAPASGDAWGAGLAIFTGDHIISNALIYSNSLSSTVALTKAMGGGVFLAAGNTLFENCAVYDNVAYSDGSSFGGGLALRGGAPVVRHCQIYNNRAEAGTRVYGGGVDIYSSSAVITAGTTIRNNGAYAYFQHDIIFQNIVVAVGGGISIGAATLNQAVGITGIQILSNTIYISGTGVVTVHGFLQGQGVGVGFYQKNSEHVTVLLEDNLIAWNTGQSNGRTWMSGGGIGGNGDGIVEGRISRNIIRNNLITRTVRGFGGGIHLSGDKVAVRNNLFFANSVNATGRADGGGMYIHEGGNYNANNTVISNTVRGSSPEGGGVRIVDCIISNTIIVSNAAYGTGANAPNGGGAAWVSANGSGYNDVWGNYPTDNYTGTIQFSTTVLINNISVDPLFIGSGSVTMTWHLQQGSPVIDAGTGANSPSGDYDRQPRPLGSAPDIGFDEVIPFTYTKSVNLDTAQENDILTYTIIISNPDPYASITDGIITDVLPADTTHSANPACNSGVCAYDSGSNTITWTGNISAGKILTLTYGVLVNSGVVSGTEITNTAFITVGATGGWTNRVTTTVTATIVSKPVFTLSKKATAAVVGAPLTYTLTITNSSADAEATGVVASDTLPAGTTYVPASGGALSDNVVTWNITSILPNSSAQVSFAITTCRTSITNTSYRVVTSTQRISSGMGAPLVTNLTSPALNADFNYAPTSSITIGQTIVFTDASTANGSPIAAWNWNFGDSHSTSGASVSHAYSAPGLYTVTLLITDTCGYTASTQLGLEIFADLRVNTVGEGTVDVVPASGPYALGKVVTLTATATPGWTFDGWSGNLTGSTNPITITMDSNKVVTATFTQDEYTLNVTASPPEGGSVVSNPVRSTYHYGDVVTLTANANAGWMFDRWLGNASGVTSPVTVTMTTDKAVTATFITQPCTDVTGVDLSLLTQGTLYPTTTVQFSADIAPDDAYKPYTYTIDYGGGSGNSSGSSDDPLAFDHTFGTVGTYTVEIAVWNCAMSSASTITDAVQITISSVEEESNHTIYLPLVMK